MLVFSCEICDIFNNVFFEEYLRTTASVVSFSWNLCWSLFLINLQVFRSATLLKRAFSTGVFLWNLWNFKNTYFEEYLQTTASVVSFSWFYVYYLHQIYQPKIKCINFWSEHSFKGLIENCTEKNRMLKIKLNVPGL